jgi:hypothetical protein
MITNIMKPKALKIKWQTYIVVINIACLVALTTASIYAWASGRNGENATGSGKVTITVEDSISGTITGGVFLSGNSTIENGLAGVETTGVTNNSIIMETTELSSAGSFNMGKINIIVDKGGNAYAYIWFTIENTGDKSITANVNLWSTTQNEVLVYDSDFITEMTNKGITTEIYSARFTENFEDTDDIIYEIERYKSNEDALINGLIKHSNKHTTDIEIAVGKAQTQNIVICYAIENASINATEFGIGVDLMFAFTLS